MFEHWFHSIHNLEKYSYRNLFCYIPEDSHENFKLDIRTVLAKNFMGYSSLDYVKKKIDKNQLIKDNDNPYVPLLNEILDTVWKVKTKFKKNLDSLKLKNETVISLGLTSTFIRLENSYESIFFLIKNLFYFESISINRLIFEQLNYCFNLAQLTPKEFVELSMKQEKKMLSPTNIVELKKYLPHSQIGKYYSDLSEIAHIDKRRIGEYLSFSEKIDEHVITMRSVTQSVISAIYLLKNIEIHGVVFEFCFYNLADIELSFLKKEKGNLELNPERETKTLYNSYVERYNKLIKEVEIPVHFMDKMTSFEDDEEYNLPF